MSKKRKKEFSQLYDQHIDKIYRYVFLKVGAREAAEDISSEVFTKSWRKFKNGLEIKNASAYLYQVARAEIANHYRSTKKVQVVSTDNLPVADNADNPEDIQIKQADIYNLRLRLRDLKEDYQDILIWRYVDGLSNEEIAKMQNKTEGAVRVTLHRAIAQLKEKMSDKWPETLFV